MGYRNLRQCVCDLEAAGRLVRVTDEVSATLEAAEIQRRLYRSGGPAVLFERVRGCRFPLLGNLFGTLERARFVFRDTWDVVRRLIELRADAGQFWTAPTAYLRAVPAALRMRPRRRSSGPVLANQVRLRDLPQLKSWPRDGGAYITLPQVYTEDPTRPGPSHSNLGMYRVQISGGRYRPDEEAGLHYQLHRGMGVHHAAALQAGVELPVNVFVGGTPAMTLAAVMPLPEGLSELGFAGVLAGHRIPLVGRPGELPVYAEADFCITGRLQLGRQLPEGPFGDHLGYYSLEHDFPVLRVERVMCRNGAIWPFTVVGRPPQEDTVFGQLIHELTAPVVPTVIPGVRAVHAVDAAGVHPLMLAIGSERYVPYQQRSQPGELLTQACAILGQGQMSLAKYLWILAGEDCGGLNLENVAEFFQQVLCRVDWTRDLHFFTRTTIDTLDYSGTGFQEGSKLIVAAAGPPVRQLPTAIPGDLVLPSGYSQPHIGIPGLLVVQGPAWDREGREAVTRFCQTTPIAAALARFPLIAIVDDSGFAAGRLDNLLWTLFTRSDPARDVDGLEAFVEHKHWGCRGPLVVDARIKPHHAPPLVEDPAVTSKIDAWAAAGGPLARWL